MSSAEHFAAALREPSAAVPQMGSWRLLGAALTLAAVGWGLVAGNQLPALMGHPEAVHGRILSLAVAAGGVAALAALYPPADAVTRVGVLIMAAFMASLGAMANWRTPVDPTWAEVLEADWWYGLSLVTLQVMLVVEWLWFIVIAVLRGRSFLDGFVPGTGFVLCAIGAWISFDAHFLSIDPKLPPPWSVPLAPGKLSQVGEFGLNRMQWAMLVPATLPALWIAARGALWWLGRFMDNNPMKERADG